MDDQQRALLAARLSTTQLPSVSLADALKNFWSRAFTYSGRASRAEYNWALALFLLYYSAVVGVVIHIAPRNSWLGVILAFTLLLVFMVPWFALISRRCHDMNRPGVFGLLLLATGIGFLITEALLMFSESNPLGSRFDRADTSVD